MVNAQDIFWIKSGNDTFITFQTKTFGAKKIKLHVRVKNCHFVNFSKMAKWHFLTCACNLIYLPNAFIWSATKVSLPDFIHNMSEAPSKCLSMWIKTDKWDNLKKLLEGIEKYIFVLALYESLQGLECWIKSIFLPSKNLYRMCE